MKFYTDMVGHYVTGYDGGVYKIIEWGGPGGHGFLLEAASSECTAPWKSISERAIDRTFYGDWHSNFIRWRREWFLENRHLLPEGSYIPAGLRRQLRCTGSHEPIETPHGPLAAPCCRPGGACY